MTDELAPGRIAVPSALVSKAPIWLAALFFVLALAYALNAMTTGWWTSLVGPQAFRQTQTAISAYYLIQGGAWLAYETPVLGPPWSIPMEFPLYQLLVAGLVTLTGMPLDQAGRAMAIFFFLASLFPAGMVLRLLGFVTWQNLMMLGLWLCSPLYLFWSRTFMIESLALFLSLSFLAIALAHLRRPRASLVFAGILFGVLAAVVKVTTLYGFSLAALLAWLWHRPVLCDSEGKWVLRPGAVTFAALFLAVPLAAALTWTHYADSVKALNVSAGGFLTSSALRDWNYGYLEQRMPAALALLIWRALIELVGSPAPAIIAVLISLLMGRAAWLPAVGAGLFLIPVLTFTNLHQHHNYYQFGISIFLLFWVGALLVRMMTRSWPWQLAGVGLAAWMVYAQTQIDWKELNSIAASRPMEVALAVKELTSPSEVIVITGAEWSSVIPYYSQRRALMDFFLGPLEGNERSMRALAALDAYPLGAGVFCGNFLTHEDRVEAAIRVLKLEQKPAYANELCQVHLKAGQPTAPEAARDHAGKHNLKTQSK
jgi:hypothetical protein